MTKPFIGICRVSSDEQEDRGFSLDVQEDRLREYARHKGYTFEKIHKIAESAFVSEKRTEFRKIIADVKKRAKHLGGVIWCSVDRASRNRRDELTICGLWEKYGLSIEFVDGDCDPSTALGELLMSIQGAHARFTSRKISETTRLSVKKRVRNGLFVGRAPFGHDNVRIDKRAFSQVNPENAAKVQRIFELYAFGNHTLDSLVETLWAEGVTYTSKQPRFKRKHLHQILRDRAYIGEVRYMNQWYPGVHKALIDRKTFERVQLRLGGRSYMRHTLTYSHGLIACGHCDRQITGESKSKMLASGELRDYIYYRCARYNDPEHPRGRVREDELDGQMLALFDRLRVEDSEVREWFTSALRARTQATQERATKRLEGLQSQLTRVRNMQNELLNGRLNGEFDQDVYAAKSTELRDDEARLKDLIDTIDLRSSNESVLIVETFELSQRLREQWLEADQAAKRRILQILSLNWTLEGKTLVPELRKPFDVLARGLVGAGGRNGDPVGI